jgi:toxin ParE1/3/4
MLPYQLHPLAAAEIEEAENWVDSQAPGRGDLIREAIYDTIEFVCQHPRVGVPYRGRIRKRRVLGFDYSVLYADMPDLIYVVAVPHAKRRPNYWTDRLNDTN